MPTRRSETPEPLAFDRLPRTALELDPQLGRALRTAQFRRLDATGFRALVGLLDKLHDGDRRRTRDVSATDGAIAATFSRYHDDPDHDPLH